MPLLANILVVILALINVYLANRMIKAGKYYRKRIDELQNNIDYLDDSLSDLRKLVLSNIRHIQEYISTYKV